MPFPKVSDWSDEVYNAGTRGAFNPLVHLKKELHRCYPDLRPYDIMLCSEDDLNNATQMGWVHMDSGHFDYESVNDFNAAVGLRFGMTIDPHGHIKVGSNYIMMMPETYRDKIRKIRKDALNRQKAQADNAAGMALSGDSRYSEMAEYAREVSAKTSSRYTVQTKGEPERGEGDAPRRGRPPKDK